MSALAKRYARALVGAASDEHTDLSLILRSLELFQKAMREQPLLEEVLNNPVFQEKRVDVLRAVLTKLDVHGVVDRFLCLLAERDRLHLLPAVVLEVLAMADASKGVLRAVVKSALPLQDVQLQRITKALSKKVGKSLCVDAVVDPSLLGGLVCHVGDLTIDNSLKSQLVRLRAHMSA